MSLTALGWLVLYCCAFAASALNPLFGTLGYLLEYYQRPELRWWGDELPDLRWNLLISLALGGGFLLRHSSLRKMAAMTNPALRSLLALWVIMLLVTLTVAIDKAESYNWFVQWTKLAIIFPMLLLWVIRTPNAFNAFVVAHMIGGLWWGWDAWQDPTRRAGRLMNVGSGDSLNDNGAAAHLLTVLPFILVYLLAEKDKRLKGVALVAAPFVVNTLILCNSRGSMVALAVAGASALFLIRSGYRLRMLGAALAMGILLLAMADDTFIRRQQTTANYEEDGSAQGRLITWKGAMRLVRDRPFGAGGRGFHLLSPIYIPEIVEAHGGDLRAPHNTWAMVAAEWGVLGFICFVALWISVFLMLERIKRRATPDEAGFYYWRAFAIQLAVIAYLVAGTFTDRLYGEAGYWMVGLACALYRIQLTQRADAAATAPDAAPADSPEARLGWPLVPARSQ